MSRWLSDYAFGQSHLRPCSNRAPGRSLGVSQTTERREVMPPSRVTTHPER